MNGLLGRGTGHVEWIVGYGYALVLIHKPTGIARTQYVPTRVRTMFRISSAVSPLSTAFSRLRQSGANGISFNIARILGDNFGYVFCASCYHALSRVVEAVPWCTPPIPWSWTWPAPHNLKKVSSGIAREIVLQIRAHKNPSGKVAWMRKRLD